MSQPKRKKIGERAAESTLALSPVVGVRLEDLLSSARATAFQAARHPFVAIRATAGYAQKLMQIAAGSKSYAPAARDRRFKDSAWSDSWLYRTWLQSYLALGESMDDWVSDAQFDELDERRARFLMSIIRDSISPTNTLPGNPEALRRIIDTGGASLVTGLKQAWNDRRHNNGMPAQVDKSQFVLGENIAATPGSVVFRNDILEVIQYKPTTEKVSRIPLLMIPPQINKFYMYDLSPEKSFVKYAVDAGFQVFIVSWCNPKPEHADWGIDAYIEALKESVTAIQAITKSAKVNIVAPCSGGITATILLGHYQSLGKDIVNAVTLSVCVLTQEESDSDISLFVNDATIEAARKKSRKQGVLRGRDLAKVFNWMRPNDLIWNYVVNNYLLGKSPPTFDILYWNNDSTNLPAQLHSDFLDIIVGKALARPGDLSVCDTPIDLTKVTCDSFITAGITDHLTPWKACYRTTGLIGGDKEFVLSSSGHIQSLLTPPGNPRAKYFTNDNLADTPDEWLNDATQQEGSWWTRWSVWLEERSGTKKLAPKKIGNAEYPAIEAAPGSYVLEPAD
jgi:polyhydroxyalkanoate synthase